MADLKAQVQLGLNNRFSGAIKTAGRDMSGFASGAAGSLSRLDKAISGTAGKLLSLGGGLSAAAALKETIDLEKRMTRLGTQANVSAAEVDKLKANIFAVSRNNKIKIDPSQLIGAVDSIIERTGDMEFIKQNLESIGMAIQASGAEGGAIGGLYAEFQKMGLGADAASQAIDTLTLQGKNGAFTLENLAALGPRVINAYTATGRSGAAALTEMGAALQVIRRGTGSSEQAATSFEALMRNLVDPVKQKKLKEMGVSVYDTTGQFRSVTDLINEVVTKSKGDLSSLGTIFDSEAMRAFNSAISEFKRSGAVSSLDEFLKMQGDGSTIMKDSARNASTMAANLTNLKTSVQSFADRNLAEPIGKVAEALNSVSPEQFDAWMNGAKNVAIGLAALKGVTMTASALSTVTSLMRSANGQRGGAAALTSGIGGGGAAGAVPVFVTNMGAGGLGSGGNGVAGALGSTAKGGLMTKLGGPAAIGLSLAAFGTEVLFTAFNDKLSNQEKERKYNTATSGLSGAMIGAAIGTAILPGIGTAVGGALGSWLMRLGAGKLMDQGDGHTTDLRAARHRTDPTQEQIDNIRNSPMNNRRRNNTLNVGDGAEAAVQSRVPKRYASRTGFGPSSLSDADFSAYSNPNQAPVVNVTNEITVEQTEDGLSYSSKTYVDENQVSAETGASSRSIQG